MVVSYEQFQGNNRQIIWLGFFVRWLVGWFGGGVSFLDVSCRFIQLLIPCTVDSTQET